MFPALTEIEWQILVVLLEYSDGMSYGFVLNKIGGETAKNKISDSERFTLKSDPNLDRPAYAKTLTDGATNALNHLYELNLIELIDVEQFIEDYSFFDEGMTEGYSREDIISADVDYVYLLTPQGALSIFQNLGFAKEVAKKIGKEALLNDFEEASRRAKIPASNRAVSLNHNSAEYRDLVDSIQQADRVIRETNAWEGVERDEIRDHLQIGLELLKKPKVYLSAIAILLLEPLQAAYSAAMEEEARIVIDVAIAAIKAFFGIG